jgi:LmbE family N-acetylglucosaminyl deacetylase
MTAGNCGSTLHDKEETARIRIAEATAAARLVGAEYHCLHLDDHMVFYDEATLVRTISLVRTIRPSVILTHSPEDYIFDHMNTANLCMTAAFTSGMQNIKTGDAEHFEPIPHLYYADAIEGKDRFGNQVPVAIAVDVTSMMDLKVQMLRCHQSQRQWMLTHHGVKEIVESLDDWSAERGALIGTAYAEGFRQHLGHAFPHDNVIQSELGDEVRLLQPDLT